MIQLSLAELALSGLCILLIYHFVVFPYFVSPLARVPNAHWSVPFSPLWILWTRYSYKEVSTIHATHERLGPVVRLGPYEVSVNCVQGGILKVYSGGFEKHDWYANLFENYGIPNMFSTSSSKAHSRRKRMLSHVYSKSYIQSSPSMHANAKVLLYDRFFPILEEYASASKVFDAYSLFSAVTMDFVTSYQFGLSASSDLLQKPEFLKHFLGLYRSRHSYNFWPQELPGLTNVLQRFGIRLVPRWVDAANGEIQDWTLKMCTGASKILDEEEYKSTQEYPEVYAQLSTALEQAESKAKRLTGSLEDRYALRPYPKNLDIASEMLDHLAAGFETSSVTLTYFVHEISKNLKAQDTLRNELRTSLDTPLRPVTSKNIELPSAKTLDGLPYLEAALRETLRLRSAIPGPEPRITPPAGATIGPPGSQSEFFIPANVRISAQAHSLHRNPAVFEDPLTWKPERWLESPEEKLKEMNRWFWAFGSGGRMCVGSNLAMYQMKYIIAALYSNWKTVVVDDEGIEQMDIYTAPPKSGRLMISLSPIPW